MLAASIRFNQTHSASPTLAPSRFHHPLLSGYFSSKSKAMVPFSFSGLAFLSSFGLSLSRFRSWLMLLSPSSSHSPVLLPVPDAPPLIPVPSHTPAGRSPRRGLVFGLGFRALLGAVSLALRMPGRFRSLPLHAPPLPALSLSMDSVCLACEIYCTVMSATISLTVPLGDS